MELVVNDHTLIPNMVEEALRLLTPTNNMWRIATEDTELDGVEIPKGSVILIRYGSGNRDEDVIENPDSFIIDRERPRNHLSYGFGIHRCVGNRLADMQLEILWEEIMKRFENIEVVGEPIRIRSSFVKGFSHLPVIIR